jgi:hypothetical protein
MGRDGQMALMMLNEAGYSGIVCAGLVELCGTGTRCRPAADFRRALRGVIWTAAGLSEQQPAWSDLPIVLLTHHGGPEQNPSHLSGSWATSPSLSGLSSGDPDQPGDHRAARTSTTVRARDRLIDLSESELRLQTPSKPLSSKSKNAPHNCAQRRSLAPVAENGSGRPTHRRYRP